MKQITTLLSFCLLFAPMAFAAPGQQTTVETSIPESSEILESPALPAAPSAQAASVISDPGSQLAPTIPEISASTPSIADPATASNSAPVNQPNTTNSNSNVEVNSLSNYLISPGDALNISVWKEEGLQEQQYMIAPDGTIIFPLVGTVIAAGKTITELKDVLSAKLADFISDPSVTVKLLNNQGNSIFVIGKVNKPGQVFSGRKIDVLQALSLAGGLTVFANESSISILRRNGTQVKVFPFNYSDVINGEELEQNIVLEPGDTVTVP